MITEFPENQALQMPERKAGNRTIFPQIVKVYLAHKYLRVFTGIQLHEFYGSYKIERDLS